MSQKLRNPLFSLLLFCLSLPAGAQLVQFHNVSLAHGLSGAHIYCIGQDQYGFMWLGSNHGLNVYDGNHFRHFFRQSENTQSLPGNDITKLVFQGDSVWVGTRSGLALMHVVSKNCHTINLGENKDIRTLLLEHNKRILWVGTNTGLIKYDIPTGNYQELNTQNSNISHNIIRSLYKDVDGNLWVGTFDKLNKLAAGANQFESLDLKGNYRSEIKNNLVLSILPAHAHNDSVLWVGTETGLVRYNRVQATYRYFREENSALSNATIKAMVRAKSGKLWIGTNFGLGAMNANFDMQLYQHDPFKNSSLINSTVWDIFEDKAGTLWFGTENGISILSKRSNRFQFHPMVFKQKNAIIGYQINDMVEDKKKQLWLATQVGLVQYSLNNKLRAKADPTHVIQKKVSVDGALKILEDRDGLFWIASNAGIVLWNPQTKQMQHHTALAAHKNGLRSNYILALFEMPDGAILVNTHKGLHRATKNNQQIQFEFLGKTESLAHWAHAHFWGVHNAQLIKTNYPMLKKQRVANLAHTTSKTLPQALLFTDNNTLWLGAKNGLYRYTLSSQKLDFFTVKSNKNFPLISLLADNDGNIWAASHAAILKFSLRTKSFEIYPTGKEIPIRYFTDGCCLKRQNGDLLFGGQDGFITFSPKQITRSSFVAPLVFSSLKIANRELQPGDKINGKVILEREIAFADKLLLDYNSGSFSISFSSLHFENRQGIRYAYWLEGHDTDWNYTNGPVGRANYSHLQAGSYNLRVKGTNCDGVWSPHEAVIRIVVKPPFWASPAMQLAYGLVFLSIVSAIIYSYTYRVKVHNQLKISALQKQHAESLAQTRQQFLTNIAHEFRTPLSLILGPTEKLAQNTQLNPTDQNYLRHIENNTRRLLWLNNQLLDFRKLENKKLTLLISHFDMIEFTAQVVSLFDDKAKRKNINYSLKTKLAQQHVQMDLRKVETILYNLLSNAFKFTPKGGEISVAVSTRSLQNENYLCIAVKDTGMGISTTDQHKIFERFYQSQAVLKMELGSGIGLTLVNEYVHMHHGKIELVSQLEKGSEFTILLPLHAPYKTEGTTVDDAKSELTELFCKPKPPNKSKKTSQNTLGKPIVLLVEDDADIADFITSSLKNRYNIHYAANGKEALTRLTQQLPDLVVCDLVMPEMNGIEFIKKLRANPKTAHIPTIILSGQTQTEQQLEGLKSGAVAYLTKPFKIDLLAVRIENFLKRRKLLEEHIKRDEIATPKEAQPISQNEKLLKQVVESVEKHINEPNLSIETVCADTGLSHAVLYRKIKKLTGQTVNEFIRTVRIRRAEQLLRTKKFSVSEIVRETGFSSHSYFTKCFRKIYNMSPKEYMDQA